PPVTTHTSLMMSLAGRGAGLVGQVANLSAPKTGWQPVLRAQDEAAAAGSARRGLDNGRHRPGAVLGTPGVGAEGVDLVLLQLGVLPARRQHDAAAAGVHLQRDLVALLRRVAEELLHHRDDVLEGVVVVVEQDDVVRRLPLRLYFFLLFGV